jgi:hypothetical protein
VVVLFPQAQLPTTLVVRNRNFSPARDETIDDEEQETTTFPSPLLSETKDGDGENLNTAAMTLAHKQNQTTTAKNWNSTDSESLEPKSPPKSQQRTDSDDNPNLQILLRCKRRRHERSRPC